MGGIAPGTVNADVGACANVLVAGFTIFGAQDAQEAFPGLRDGGEQ